MLKISIGVDTNKKTGKPSLSISTSYETDQGDVPSTQLREKIDLEELAKKEAPDKS